MSIQNNFPQKEGIKMKTGVKKKKTSLETNCLPQNQQTENWKNSF